MSRITLLFGTLLALGAWLTPNHYLPWLAFHGELLMGLALGVALAGEFAQQPRHPDRLSSLTLLTLLLAGIPLLQVATGLIRFAGDAWVVCTYLLAFALAQVLGRRLLHRLGGAVLAEGLAVLFVAASLLSVGVQLYQWLRLSGLGVFAADMPPWGTPFANLAQHNHLATLLFLGLVGSLFLYEHRRIRGWAAAATILFLEAGMVMTGSRAAWLNVLLLTVVLCLSRRRLALRLPLHAAPGLAVAMGVLVAAWGPLNDILLLSAGRTLAVQAQVGPRPLFYATMFDALAQRPWFGYGWNQGLIAQGQVLDAHPAAGRLMGSSHNLLLDLVVWNGVPLGLALAGFMAWWLWRQWRACRGIPQAFMLAAVVGVLVHAMLEYPLSYAYFLLPVGVMMGALDAALPNPREYKVPRLALPAGAIATGALLVLIVVDYVEVEANTRLLRFETARIGTSGIESQAPELMMLTQWHEYLRFARIAPQPGMSEAEIDRMRRVVERFPYASAQRKYALANALNGQPDVARRTLDRMCKLHTARNCAAELGAWVEQMRSQYPQLAAVPLPRRF